MFLSYSTWFQRPAFSQYHFNYFHHRPQKLPLTPDYHNLRQVDWKAKTADVLWPSKETSQKFGNTTTCTYILAVSDTKDGWIARWTATQHTLNTISKYYPQEPSKLNHFRPNLQNTSISSNRFATEKIASLATYLPRRWPRRPKETKIRRLHDVLTRCSLSKERKPISCNKNTSSCKSTKARYSQQFRCKFSMFAHSRTRVKLRKTAELESRRCSANANAKLPSFHSSGFPGRKLLQNARKVHELCESL